MRLNEDTSTAFKSWFNKSVVTTTGKPGGKPLPVYHGSKSSFDRFDIESGGQSNNLAKVGFWFSPVKDFGKKFASEVWYGNLSEPITYSVFLSLQNPKVFETTERDENKAKELANDIEDCNREMKELNKKFGWNALVLGTVSKDDWNAFYNGKGLDPARLEIIEARDRFNELTILEKELDKDLQRLWYCDAYEKFKTDVYEVNGKTAKDANIGGLGMSLPNVENAIKTYRDFLKSEGYDGIVIKNTHFDSKSAGSDSNTQYVALYPWQIKSIKNKGSWNKEDDRLLESVFHQVYSKCLKYK